MFPFLKKDRCYIVVSHILIHNSHNSVHLVNARLVELCEINQMKFVIHYSSM
jgi:hypothetical protein